jgi:hypothetical protein
MNASRRNKDMSDLIRRWCWLALLPLCACQPGVTPWDSRQQAGQGGGTGDPYISQQGTLLLGFNGSDVRTFTLAAPFTRPRVLDDGQLVSDGGAGADLKGAPVAATATDGTAIAMRITEVHKPEPGGHWHYALEDWSTVDQSWHPACADPPQVIPAPPGAPPPLAIALPGSWTADGFYVADAGRVSFSCATGVAAKCVSWGYPPAWVPPSHTQTGHASTATGNDVFQACTRVARADYCGGGIPNTLDGTPIHVHDVFGGPLPPEHAVEGFVFEAAWPGLASLRDRGSQPRPALCLSKQRWSTLPLGGACPLVVPDPRLESKARFCEDMTAVELEAKNALVESDSAYLDAGLYRWSENGNPATFTTAALVPDRPTKPPVWLVSPPAVAVPQQTARFEGAIFNRALPAAMPLDDLVELHSYRCGDDIVTTTADLSSSCQTIVKLEGYLYTPYTAGRSPLRRWWNRTLKRSQTTTTSPTTMIAAGWQLVQVEGALPRAAMDLNLRWSLLGAGSYALDVQTKTGAWVTPCIDQSVLGGATAYVYRGVCPSAANRTVANSDVRAFRVRYTAQNGSGAVVVPYDGAASDVYVPLPGGQTTALTVSWNEVGPTMRYALDVDAGGGLVRCADDTVLGNDLSFVFTGYCPTKGGAIPIGTVKTLRLCAASDGNWKTATCGNVPYDGRQPSVALRLAK